MMYQIKIYNSGDHSIASFNSYIVATNVMITDPKRYGVYSEGAEARINMNQVKFTTPIPVHSVSRGAREITARSVLIEDPKNEGIYIVLFFGMLHFEL